MNKIIMENITIKGKSICIRKCKKADTDSIPLICLHGNLGSGRWFEPLLERYSGFAIAPDLPNFGQSDHIDSWNMENYADWTAAICESLNISSAVILGHSLGGAVAMDFLNRYSRFVKQLILVDSSPINGLVTPKEYYPAIEAYKTDKNILSAALKSVVPTLQDETFYNLLLDDAWKMNRDCFIGHAETLSTADYSEKLQNTSIKVNVLRGAFDALITEEHAKAMAEYFSCSVHTFDNCGHSPMVEIPDKFCAVLQNLLQEDP